MALHEILTRRREDLGYTIDDLVAKSGVPKGTVAKIMSGITPNPQFETLRSIAYALGLALEDLDDSDHRSQPTPPDLLYVSMPSGDATTDELRKYLHDIIDQLPDDDLRLLKDVTLRIRRE